MENKSGKLKADTKYYYVIINKKGQLLLSDSKLPIYWMKKVAQKEAIKHEGATVQKIYSIDLIDAINKIND